MIKEFINIVESMEGITDDWFKHGSFDTYKLNKPVPYNIADSDGVTKTLEGPVEHRAGHYIMGPGPKGEFWPLDPDNFRSKYNDNNDGTATPKKIDKIAKLADHDGFVTVDWGSGPQKLFYTAGNDYIVRHGEGDYGVVKKDIFAQTYEVSK
jgi:hypothetical protein